MSIKLHIHEQAVVRRERGVVGEIYPGKVSGADRFRIGIIGHLFERDMLALADAIEAVIAEMGVSVRTQIA